MAFQRFRACVNRFQEAGHIMRVGVEGEFQGSCLALSLIYNQFKTKCRTSQYECTL